MFKGYLLGAVDYLFKPVRPEVLRSKVSVFVELWTKNRQLEQHIEAARQLRHLVNAVDLATALLRSRTDADCKRALEVLEQARP